MRFELAGTLVRPEPVVVRYDSDQNFDTAAFIELGYTHFDVICIGGGGGSGGGIDTQNSGTLVRNTGGAGGGGGFHRVRGLLSALPASCPVVVGAGGIFGNEHSSDPALTTDGGDGEASTFNTTTCRASGGKGGKRAQSNSVSVRTFADGGEGGIGNRVIAGGGAAGGVSGIPVKNGPNTPGTPGADGTFFNNIGKGGGGGAGGVGEYGNAVADLDATAGGRGSYNPGDTSVYGPGYPAVTGPLSGIQTIIPGGASGAKAAPVNGLPTIYGASTGNWLSGNPGIVVIRLTAE